MGGIILNLGKVCVKCPLQSVAAGGIDAKKTLPSLNGPVGGGFSTRG